MKYLKMLGLAAFAAMAFTAFVGASTASATTLEVGGVKQLGSVAITASIKAETSAVLRDTFGFNVNTCTTSNVKGKTTIFTGTYVTGPVEELSFTNCTHDGIGKPVIVHNPGQLYIDWEGGTNGLVYSEEADVTVYSTIHGTYITCTTGTGTLIGTLTGAGAGNHATMDINAVLNCGPHVTTAKWTGTYTVTSPTGLGVVE